MTTTITPMALAKPNLVRQRIGFGLIDRVPAPWTHKSIDPESPDPKRPLIIETKRTGSVLKNPLAGNVSQLNVDRFIERIGA